MTKTITFDFSNPSGIPHAVSATLKEGQETQKIDPSTAQKTMAEMDTMLGKYMARIKQQNEAMSKQTKELSEQDKKRYELHECLMQSPEFTASIDVSKREKPIVIIADRADKWRISVPLSQETSAKLDLQSLIQTRSATPTQKSVVLEPPKAAVKPTSTLVQPSLSKQQLMSTQPRTTSPSVHLQTFDKKIISGSPTTETKTVKPKEGLFSRFTSWFRGSPEDEKKSASATKSPVKMTRSLNDISIFTAVFQALMQTPEMQGVLNQELEAEKVLSDLAPLPNGKNICFINAVIQALMNAPEICEILVKAHELKAKRELKELQQTSETNPSFLPLFHSYLASMTLIEALKSYPHLSVDLNDLRGFIEDSIKGTVQEDACEFLDKIFEPIISLLEHEEETTPELFAALKGKIFQFGEVKKFAPFTPEAKDSELYQKELAKKTNPSELPKDSTLKKLENSLIIPSELPSQKTELQDLLQSQFTMQKPLEQDPPSSYVKQGQLGWYQVTEKEVAIETIGTIAPQFVTLQLKRFKNKPDGTISKIHTEIELPKDHKITLIVNGQKVQYEIQSLVLHYGATPESGHYFSYLRKNEAWYIADDRYIHHLHELPSTTGSQVYMIFLKRV